MGAMILAVAVWRSVRKWTQDRRGAFLYETITTGEPQ
jgi:hypothetical protein